MSELNKTAALPSDHESRNRAIVEFDKNMVVVAGAGSGKTSLLIERVLYQLLSAEIEPATFVAMTFTESAAAEMRARLRSSLEQLATLPPEELQQSRSEAGRLFARLSELEWSPEQIAEYSNDILSKLDAASVVTIHGFCSNLLRRHPVESGVSVEFRVDEGGELERLLDATWPEVLRSSSADPVRAAELEEILELTELSDLRKVFDMLVKSPAPLEAWAAGRIPELDNFNINMDAFRGAPERLRAMAAVAGATLFGNMCVEAAERIEFVISNPQVPLRTRFSSALDAVDASQKLSKEDRDWAEKICKELRHLWETDHAGIAKIIRWLAAPALETQRRRTREGWIAFDGLLVSARNLLRDHPEVRRDECRRFRAIFVDEFQDTDPLQYEIVLLLSENLNVPPARDPWSVQLSPGKLFVVGDPKQSIYRFRGADIGAYARAVDKIVEQGGAVLRLNVSFRSPSEILKPIDKIFVKWLDAQTEDEEHARAAPEYDAIVSFRPEPKLRFGGSPRVEIWSVAGTRAEQRRESEAEWIAAHIAENMNKRGLSAGEHSILLRAFSNVYVYSRALQKRNIPFLLEGGRTFYERVEVTDLLSWLRAVAEPNDSVAHLAALRSVAGAVPDAELARYANAGGAFSSNEIVDAQLFPGIHRTFTLIKKIRSYSSLAPDDAVRKILFETHLIELHAGGFDGAQRVANLEKCEQIASSLALDQRLTLHEITKEFARRLTTADVEPERSLSEAGIDAVRLITIHKSKGLEFDIVYLADLAREDGGKRGESYLKYHESERALEVYLQSSRRRTRASVEYKTNGEIHENAEDRRLFYVASTRARERLIFVAGEARSSLRTPWRERLCSAFSYDPEAPDRALLSDGLVLHCAQPAKIDITQITQAAAADALAPARRFLALQKNAAGARPPLVAPAGGGDFPGADSGESEDIIKIKNTREMDEFGDANDRIRRTEAIAAGVAVHQILQRADFASGEPLISNSELEKIARTAARDAHANENGVVSDVKNIMVAFEKSKLRERLRKVKIIARELPLLAHNSNVAGAPSAAGFADLVFEESGELVVADWKTGHPARERGANENAQFSEEERYSRQVLWYVRAVAETSQRPARAELFFIRADCSIVIKPPEN
ncbi:MAG: UvrD-helicase domain-containing protein [Planctomycetota bacterium]